jgi:hypothetical protein
MNSTAPRCRFSARHCRTGQFHDAQSKTLRFAPKMPAPFELPVLVPGTVLTLSASADGEYELKMLTGMVLSSLCECDMCSMVLFVLYNNKCNDRTKERKEDGSYSTHCLFLKQHQV